MKRLLLVAALASISASALAADVGVSISVGQPGFYGQIDIGGAPPPQVIYQQPVIVQPVPVTVAPPPPVYMHVPPGWEKHWSRHCGQYGACGRPVYFVHDNWYNNVYAPHYREEHRGHWEDHDGDRDRGDRGDRDWGDRHDHGHGHGHDRD